MKINWLEKYRQIQAEKNGLKESLPQQTDHLNTWTEKDDDNVRGEIEIIRKADCVILKEIELFPLNGIMVRARLFNGKISVIDPDQFSEEDKILVDETIREFGLCEADFGIVGGVI